MRRLILVESCSDIHVHTTVCGSRVQAIRWQVEIPPIKPVLNLRQQFLIGCNTQNEAEAVMITQSSRLPFHLPKGEQIGQASSRGFIMTSLPTCFQTEGYILF